MEFPGVAKHLKKGQYYHYCFMKATIYIENSELIKAWTIIDEMISMDILT